MVALGGSRTMDARCEVCGLDVKVSDEELARRGVVEVECTGCGARREVTSAAPCAHDDGPAGSEDEIECADAARAYDDAGGIEAAGAYHGGRVSHGRSDVPGASDGDERLEDLRTIARQSLSPQGHDADAVALDAPPSVRELIRAGKAIELFDSKRARRRRVAMGVAAAIVAAGATALGVHASERARTRIGVPVDVPTAAQAPTDGAEPPADATSPERAPEPLTSIAPNASIEHSASEPAGESASEPADHRRSKSKSRTRKRGHSAEDARGDDSAARERTENAPDSPGDGASTSVAAPPESPAGAAPSLSDAIAQAVGAKGSTGAAPGPFDRAAALAALRAAGSGLQNCKLTIAAVGSSGVSVRFVPNGSVDAAAVDGPPFAGTQSGKCIEQLFRKAHVPPFSGPPVIVHRSFTIK